MPQLPDANSNSQILCLQVPQNLMSSDLRAFASAMMASAVESAASAIAGLSSDDLCWFCRAQVEGTAAGYRNERV